MKVFLDKNLDHRLRNNLGAHDIFTVAYKGWAGLKNGEFLPAAEQGGIEVFLTEDQTPSYEQNLSARTIAIVVLSSIEFPILKNHLPKIIATLDNAFSVFFQAVDCSTFTRKPPRREL